MVPLSVLDLAPVPEGSDARDAFRNSVDLAQHAERWGFHRYWLAEHHNMPGIASAATSLVIGHVAANTATIRVGAGGIMLPNHAPLVVAEQFGTLASLHPGRIDLGLGRAPGTDPRTMRALRRDNAASADRFPHDVVELLGYFAEPNPSAPVRAVPGEGLGVPIWLLGSSTFSAELAAMLGLPFAFASHFAPDSLMPALAIYRRRFRPSAYLKAPHAMVGVNVFAADDARQAERLATSSIQAFANLRRGVPGKLPPPVDDIRAVCTPEEIASIGRVLAYSIVGDAGTVRARFAEIIAETEADEIIVGGQMHDHAARLRSFEIVAEVAEMKRD